MTSLKKRSDILTMSDISTLDTIDRDELHDHLLDEIEDRFNVLTSFLKTFENESCLDEITSIIYHLHYLKNDMKETFHVESSHMSNEALTGLYSQVFKEV